MCMFSFYFLLQKYILNFSFLLNFHPAAPWMSLDNILKTSALK